MSPYEDLGQIFSRARAEFLRAEILEDQQVDACQLLDEVATSARRVGLSDIRREVKRVADERGSAGANRADSEGRDRRPRARHSATRAARSRAVRRGRRIREAAAVQGDRAYWSRARHARLAAQGIVAVVAKPAFLKWQRPHLAAWVTRNEQFGPQIARALAYGGIVAEVDASRHVGTSAPIGKQ
jgi:hypothetical protein